MKKLKTRLTTKGQTTVPKPVREFLGVREHDPVYWEVKDGDVRISTEEPALFRWFGAIRVGRGSIARDLVRARRMRGRK